MPKTIQQTVKLGASPEALFDIYLDSKKHGAAVNARASMSRKVGGKFSIWDGMIRGRNLAIVPKKMIVQSWRGSSWRKSDLDSLLVLTFSKASGGGQINLVHANVPDQHAAGIQKGWHTYYWKPWNAYLKQGKRR